jgi:hypothetical protein
MSNLGRWQLKFIPFALACALPILASDSSQDNNAPGAVETEMRNVVYHFTDRVEVHIRELRGQLVPVEKQEYPIFDDKNSFTIAIRSADIAISATALANALNSYVFSGHDSPLKGVSIRVDKGLVHVKGRLASKGDVPFETAGTIAPTADGKVVLHSRKIKALHLPVKGMMDLFGIDTSDLVDTNKLPGIDAEKDDLILDPALILPPPHISGAVKAVRVEGQDIILTIGEKADTPAPGPVKNFMSFRGNKLAFGKLLMNSADMAILDTTPNDPFDFFLDHYKDQLAAGYTKITTGFSLRVFMPDYNKLPRNKSKQTQEKPASNAARS